VSQIWKDKPFRGARRSEHTPPPLPRAVENGAANSPTLVLFVLIATVGVLAYTFFLLNPANRGDWLPYSLVITAEVILVTQALVSMWTILSGGIDPRDFAFHHSQERLFDAPTIEKEGTEALSERWGVFLDDARIGIDVFITAYGEDLATIRRTAMAAIAMRGEHLTWILDDGGWMPCATSRPSSAPATCAVSRTTARRPAM
jgi:cellulose synthase (UDP-forming)